VQCTLVHIRFDYSQGVSLKALLDSARLDSHHSHDCQSAVSRCNIPLSIDRIKQQKRAIIGRFAQSNDVTGLTQALTTLMSIALLWWAALVSAGISLWLTATEVVLLTLFTLRVFALMHECGHGRLFRSQWLNRATGFVLGVLSGMPQYVWSQHHTWTTGSIRLVVHLARSKLSRPQLSLSEHAAGIVLFTVQHNFDHAYASDSQRWDYTTGAIRGTSFLVLPAWLNWFTVNMGYHHIHHLSAIIPNYRLARCHNESQHLFPDVRRLKLSQIHHALKCILWDQRGQQIISVAEYRQQTLAAVT
jgi:fatty acid desaturase